MTDLTRAPHENGQPDAPHPRGAKVNHADWQGTVRQTVLCPYCASNHPAKAYCAARDA